MLDYYVRRTIKVYFTQLCIFQVAALDQLKLANPNGRFWIKIDGTDVKTALMESTRRVWNGDEDLGDGHLQSCRKQYEDRLHYHDKIPSSHTEMCESVCKIVNDIDIDIKFSANGFKEAVVAYRDKYNSRNTSEQTLKNANWEVVEYQSLLEEAQGLKVMYESCLALLNQVERDKRQFLSCKSKLKDMKDMVARYLKNLFKKKRVAADHNEVVMVSDEKRLKKPYALPVKFVPCRTLRDQYIRDLTKQVKEAIMQRGLTVVGNYYY